MNQEKAKKIEETIKSLFSSLESHLPYTYLKSSEGKYFHRKCVKNYARDINNLANLL
jgi:hypothetical protein